MACKFWDYDDVGLCARQVYINKYVPLVIASAAAIYILVNFGYHFYRFDIKKVKYVDKKDIDHILFEEEEAAPLLNGSSTNHASINSKQCKDSLMDRHFSLEKLELVNPDGTSHGVPTVIERSYKEKFRVFVEFMLVFTQVIFHFHVLNNLDLYKSDFTYGTALISVTTWLMLFAIVTLRLLNINNTIKCINLYPGNLWSVSFACYMFFMLTKVLLFRSALIGHLENSTIKNYYTLQFYLNFSLFLLLFLSPIGNNLPIVYKTNPSITVSPEPTASIASFISWSWLNSFLYNAYKKSLEEKNIWGLYINDYSMFVIKDFRAYLKSFSTNKSSKRGFSFILLTFFSNYFMLQAFWAAISGFVVFVPTVLLKRVLEYVDDQKSAPKNLAWFYVVLMFCARVLVAVFDGQALFFGRRVCVRMRSILISEIYAKALRRQISNEKKETDKDDEGTEVDPQEENDKKNIDGDEESSQSANLGSIINLMAVDAFKVSEICGYLHAFVEATIMTLVALGFLYKILGFAAIIGAALIIIMLPINFKFASLLGEYQKKSLAITDKRIQKLNETFQAIRIIKFFSWEENFLRDILDVREKELRMLLLRSFVWALSSFVWFITPSIVTSCSFAFYIYVQGETLTTPIAFTALSLFTLLKNPLDQLADMLSFVIQSKVSLDRIQNFLEEADTKKYNQLTTDPTGSKLSMENVTVTWNEKKQDFKLRDININFMIGKLNVVIGPTGSGKTSLLMALLGEMHLLSGKIIVPSLEPRKELVVGPDGLTNSMAYCSQAAWLLNDTVRNNILFSSSYVEERYNAVIEACGLKRDFEILSAGDMTEIGERGITLSGGQKQRVSLARALYSNSKTVLLDDCLSAVDSHTAAWIYENCIVGPLMEGRTCILVSHNVALTLKNAEQVILLENGRIKEIGDPITLLQNGHFGEDELVKSSILSRHNSSTNLANKSTTTLSTMNKKLANSTTKPKISEEERKKAGKLVEEETKAEGSVNLDIYKWYLDVFGGLKVVLVLAAVFIVAQGVYIGQSWWVRNWVSKNVPDIRQVTKNLASYSTEAALQISSYASILFADDSNNDIVTKETKHSTAYYLSIFFLIGLTQAVLSAVKTMFSFYTGINASRKIFNMLLNKALHAKLRFFDATPIGRIMNRFSKDIEAVDQELTPYVEGVFYCIVALGSTVILITYITPAFFIVAIFVTFLYYFVGTFYLTGSRELKRFESTTKSPIYQHFSETLVGVTTVRAYGDETRFMHENVQKIDENNKPFFYLWVANRWLAFRIDMIGSLVIFGAGVFILLNIDNIDSGLAGISLTFAISFTEGALWLVRYYSNLEMNMNSVERLKEYMNIEQEPYDSGVAEVPSVWPVEGKIEVNDLSLRYAPSLPRVIKNVTFTIDPKIKVGVVGRTGAGKSTIITALFRFLDPETGYIKIDNIDITSIDLKRLRRSITIIPQDPTLFTGTIKSNLDPYKEFSDSQIFEALKRVNLVATEELSQQNIATDAASMRSENANKFLDLESSITEGGGNLCQGERQLMCLARSLLRMPKIILLDEATASIDYASDAKIQETIRTEFNNSTILTIAHRLRTVIDYDKILVMDAGEVKEYDHPYSLLLNKNSLFYSMCEQSGELDSLIELSKEAFVKKLNSK